MSSKSAIRSVLFSVLLVLTCWAEQARGAGVAITRWVNPTDGLWTDASKWSSSPFFPDNGHPTSTDTYEVLIDATGSPYTVSLNDSDPVKVDSLTLDSIDAMFSTIYSTLTTPLIDIREGTFAFGSGARIEDATITGDGNFVIDTPSSHEPPVFSNVTLEAAISVPSGMVSPPRRGLRIENGLSVASSGELALSSASLVEVAGIQSFAGEGEIVLRGGALRFAENTTVTIEPTFTIRAVEMLGAVGGRIPNIGLVNYGLLSGEASNAPLEIMNAPRGNGTTFLNYGEVQAIGEGVVVVGGSWSNNGTFRLRDNARLFLSGEFTPDDIGTIDRQGGQLLITGRLENRGKTITANAETGDIIFGRGNFDLSSPVEQRIIGGTIAAVDGAQWTFQSGELFYVTLAADATLHGTRVHGDLTLVASTLSIGRMIFERASPFTQRVAGTGLIQFDSSGGGEMDFRPSGDWAIESGITIETTTANGGIRANVLFNEGLIRSQVGTSLDFEATDFTNRGTIDIAGRTGMSTGNNHRWRNEGTIYIRSTGQLSLRGNFTSSDLGTIIDEGGNVQLNGTMDLEGNTLDLETWPFASNLRVLGGTLRNGRITSSGDAALDVSVAAIFDNITLATDLFLPGGAGATLHVANGLTLEDVTITMPEGAAIRFQGDTQFLSGTGILYAPNHPATSAVTDIVGDRLVIGEHITIRNGDEAWRELNLRFEENRGTILAEAPNSLVTIGRNIHPSLGPLWSNNGTILVQDGTVEFRGNYGLEHLGDIQQTGGNIVLSGELLNQGVTIVQDPTTPQFQFRGTVRGGTISGHGGVVADLGGRFDGVTLQGSAVVSNPSGVFRENLTLLDDLTLDDAVLHVPANRSLGINLTQPVSILGHGEILLDGPSDATRIAGSALTIGEGVTVRTGPSGGGTISRFSLPVINFGTIAASTPGQTMVVDGDLTNFGTLRSTSDSLLRIDSDSWVNQGILEVGLRGEFGGTVITSDSFWNGADGQITGSGHLELTRASLVNSGSIAPGIEVGKIELHGNLEMTDSAVLTIDVFSPQAIDQLRVFGSVSLNGFLELNVPSPGTLSQGATYEIVRSFGPAGISGRFANPMDQIQVGHALFQINYSPAAVWLTVLNVPEPGTLAMILLGCGGFASSRRRNQT